MPSDRLDWDAQWKLSTMPPSGFSQGQLKVGEFLWCPAPDVIAAAGAGVLDERGVSSEEAVIGPASTPAVLILLHALCKRLLSNGINAALRQLSLRRLLK